MQFKHPEILYALLLLLIPLFIHLFQLRRFQKVPFTNVAFLKKVQLQTRKSATLKKWLTMLARMLALACLVLAFAQPVATNKSALDQQQELVIYIDNSFSMQARGPQGPLLDRALNDLFSGFNGHGRLSYFSNDRSRQDISYTDFRNEIIQTSYSFKQLPPDQWLLKAQQLFSDDPSTSKRLILVSDFQQAYNPPVQDSGFTTIAIPLRPTNTNNISIDSLYLEDGTDGNVILQVRTRSQLPTAESIPISVYDEASDARQKLVAKTAINLEQETQQTMGFDLEVGKGFTGRVEIEEPVLGYDNQMYFSIDRTKTAAVLVIDQGDSSYLNRLYNNGSFDLEVQDLQQLDYGLLQQQQFVILNELQTIPAPLEDALIDLVEQGSGICVVPAQKIDLASYNKLLSRLGMGTLDQAQEQEIRMTQIRFDHPLFKEVFERSVSNFQYPQFQRSFEGSGSGPEVLGFENGTPLLSGIDGKYLFYAPLNTASSNFQGSPLIVPIFLNMVRESLPLPALYFELGSNNSFAIPATLGSDQVLSLSDSISSFIPRQQPSSNSVLVQTRELPDRAGIYLATTQTDTLARIAFNTPRSEGRLDYADPTQWEGVLVKESMDELFEFLDEANSVDSFWKWFAIFAGAFLLIEMMILKFYP